MGFRFVAAFLVRFADIAFPAGHRMGAFVHEKEVVFRKERDEGRRKPYFSKSSVGEVP